MVKAALIGVSFLAVFAEGAMAECNVRPDEIRMLANGDLERCVSMYTEIGTKTVVINKRRQPESYIYDLALVGGLRPGETKVKREVEADVRMKWDRSIIVQWNNAGYGPDGILIEPSANLFRPGDLRYKEILQRTGPMKPWQLKPLLKR